MSIKKFNYKNKLGYLNIALDGESIIGAFFFDNKESPVSTSLPEYIRLELDAYFAGEEMSKSFIKKHIDISKISGTQFQKKVWSAILSIKHGETATYTDLAKWVGSEGAARAAGTACAANQIALFIPCHRVLRKNGEDYRYSWGADRKKFLLGLEVCDRTSNPSLVRPYLDHIS